MEKQEKSGKIEEKVQQQEETVLKTATQFFADELLGFLGIEGEVARIAPTETGTSGTAQEISGFQSGHPLPAKERVKGAFLYTREAKEVGGQERQKIEAMIYTMATKFLEAADLEEMKEVVRMTELGRMLMNDGIAEKTGLSLEKVRELKKEKENEGEL